MHSFEISLLIGIICISTAFLIIHIYSHKSSLPIRCLLVFFVLFSLFHYTNYGNFFTVKKDTPEFIELTGSQSKSTYMHWHEIYHYYFGAKYYGELGHFGLYNAVAQADSESGKPMLSVKFARDLANPIHPITIEEAKKRGREIYKPRFSDDRWQEFKRDLEYMKELAFPSWLDLGMFDAGFNPPPTWSVIGHTIANLIPISDPWFDYGITWDQAEFLPFFDLILMVVAAYFIYRSFGFIGLLIFLVAFFTSFVSNPRWITGAFLRHIWLFSIIMGICMLKQEKYFKSGVFLGLGAMMRIFPAVFAVGVVIALFLQFKHGKKTLADLRQFIYGGIAISVTLILLSLVMFGPDAWKEFFTNILAHKHLNFVAHIGYQKFATFDVWTPAQNFWWQDGLDRFRSWNQRLNDSWDDAFAYHFPFIAVFFGALTWAMKKLPAEESTLLFGIGVIYFFEIPANYYYSFMCLVPVVALSNAREGGKDQWKDITLASSFFFMWAIMYYMPNLTRDDILYTYYLCTVILVFLLFWVLLRLVEIKDIKQLVEYSPDLSAIGTNVKKKAKK